MKTAYRFVAVTLALLALALAAARTAPGRGPGPAVPGKADREAVADTVRKYNRVLQDFYASNGVPLMLDEFPASKRMRHEVFRDIGYLRDRGKVMVLDMATLTIDDIEPMGSGVFNVTTYEDWNYVFADVEARERTGRARGLSQGFAYVVARRGSKWLVLDAHPTDLVLERGDEFLY